MGRKYVGGDGREKATIEQVFGSRSSEASSGGSSTATQFPHRQQPWSMGWQMNERNVVWNDDLKIRLLKRVATEQLNISEEELVQRISELALLIPDFEVRMKTMRAQDLVALCRDIEQVPQKLMRLKQIFPGADTAKLAAHRVDLLCRDDLDQVAADAAELRRQLPRVDIDRLAQDHPAILHVRAFLKAVAKARVVLRGQDVEAVLGGNPSLVLALQSGEDMIPYDEVPTQTPKGAK